MSRLRILCLHGFSSNGAIHAHQTRRLVAALPEIEFLFPDAPHTVDAATNFNLDNPAERAWVDFVAESSTAGHRAWWFAREADPSSSSSSGEVDRGKGGEKGDFVGVEESLRFLGEYVRRETGDDGGEGNGSGGGSEIHGVWGFSQGGCLAGMLCALSQEVNREHPLRKLLGSGWLPKEGLRAGVVISGFKPRFERFDEIYEHGIAIPTIHVLGEEDRLVVRERSEKLIDVCRDAEVIVHPGGHDIPRREEDQGRIVKFLKQRLGSGNGMAVSL